MKSTLRVAYGAGVMITKANYPVLREAEVYLIIVFIVTVMRLMGPV